MSFWDDYRAEAQFAHDFPFDVPSEYWHSKEGDILVTDMTEAHIKNCMRMVGEDDDWYLYFQKELDRRTGVNKISDSDLNEMIDWCRKKMKKENRLNDLTGKRLEGYKEAMLQVMSYLHSRKDGVDNAR